ncbi:transcriptional regulator [Streptomyces sp. NPDC028635]|uniref:transcriptional regulator n=1 Tax=Streptomyces sp. NPDC028635 TaxID=3154800 RepID=UPI0033FE3F1E
MTVVEAPPPLPVRDKAMHEPAGGVSPMLTRLAAERATGVLVREGGTLHLADGMVVHAESPYAPGPGVLLTAQGAISAEQWWAAAGVAGDPAGTARLLVDAGHLSWAGMEICHLQALYDAAYFALAPSSSPGRFHYATTARTGTRADARADDTWADERGGARPDDALPGARPGEARLGARPGDALPGDALPVPRTGEAQLGDALPAVPVAAVEREVLRRRALLHRLWPDPLADGAPLVRTDPVAAPAVTARQAAVLALVDGVRTAPDIALALGRRAFPTLVEVRRLAAAGLLSPPPQPPPAAAPPPAVVSDDFDPHIALLKRVRDALEAL